MKLCRDHNGEIVTVRSETWVLLQLYIDLFCNRNTDIKCKAGVLSCSIRNAAWKLMDHVENNDIYNVEQKNFPPHIPIRKVTKQEARDCLNDYNFPVLRSNPQVEILLTLRWDSLKQSVDNSYFIINLLIILFKLRKHWKLKMKLGLSQTWRFEDEILFLLFIFSRIHRLPVPRNY